MTSGKQEQKCFKRAKKETIIIGGGSLNGVQLFKGTNCIAT